MCVDCRHSSRCIHVWFTIKTILFVYKPHISLHKERIFIFHSFSFIVYDAFSYMENSISLRLHLLHDICERKDEKLIFLGCRCRQFITEINSENNHQYSIHFTSNVRSNNRKFDHFNTRCLVF